MVSLVGLLSLVLLSVHCDVYFKEEFDTASRWTKSTKKSDLGDMEVKQRESTTDASAKGFKTMQDSRFYHYSAPLDKEFSTVGKDLYFEYSLRHEQSLSCGGGYMKLLSGDYNTNFDGESEYAFMFGPDTCGNDKRIHLICSHGGKNHLKTTDIDYVVDSKLHVYSFIFKKDKSYDVLLDGASVAHGKIEDDFELFGKPEIDDPSDVKPDDWIDEAEISDADAKKPEDWDQPEFIPDTDAVKPDDWNDKDDGEWTAPTKENPDYKGEWHAPQIKNPDYKGPFVPKKIPNPDYKYDKSFCEYLIKAIGLDLWQVQAGSSFDRIFLTDDSEEALKYRKESLKIAKEENQLIKESEKEPEDSEDDKADEL